MKLEDANSEELPRQFKSINPIKINNNDSKLISNHPDINVAKHKGITKAYIDKRFLISLNDKELNPRYFNLEEIIESIFHNGYSPRCIGIDLSGSENKPSGICILDNKDVNLQLIKSDKEIISLVSKIKPTVISIDSPLGLPKGRCCVEDICDCRRYGITRENERILIKRGLSIYPSLIKCMQNLTIRGMDLANYFKKSGYIVIESYPGATQDILRFPRKKVDLKSLEENLRDLGFNFQISESEKITHDEIDALTSALVGYFYLSDQYEEIGNDLEQYLVLPKFN